MENEPITFKEYLGIMGGSGVVYESECRTILHEWKTANWIKVDEYISPIVSEILVDAAETNRPMYEKIMNCVMEAYPELKKELGFRPTLTRIK
jgi:hypothetical protein